MRRAPPSPGTAGLPSTVPTATGFSSQTALCDLGKNLDPTKFSFLTQEKISTRSDLTRAQNVSPLILMGAAGREWTAGSGHPATLRTPPQAGGLYIQVRSSSPCHTFRGTVTYTLETSSVLSPSLRTHPETAFQTKHCRSPSSGGGRQTPRLLPAERSLPPAAHSVELAALSPARCLATTSDSGVCRFPVGLTSHAFIQWAVSTGSPVSGVNVRCPPRTEEWRAGIHVLLCV